MYAPSLPWLVKRTRASVDGSLMATSKVLPTSVWTPDLLALRWVWPIRGAGRGEGGTGEGLHGSMCRGVCVWIHKKV